MNEAIAAILNRYGRAKRGLTQGAGGGVYFGADKSTLAAVNIPVEELEALVQAFKEMKDPSQTEEALQRLSNHAEQINAEETSLDEAVIDWKSAEAGDLNNEGMEAQARYLLESGLPEHEIKVLMIGGS